MEIMERAKSGGEVVPWNQDVREEALKRGAKAGYVTRNGEDPRATKIQVCGGFGESKLNLWPRDESGNLIE